MKTSDQTSLVRIPLGIALSDLGGLALSGMVFFAVAGKRLAGKATTGAGLSRLP